MSEILKVAVLEPFRSDYMDMPIGNMYWLGDESDPVATGGIQKTYHGKHVYETIVNTVAEIAPEYLDRIQIDLFPNVKTGMLNPRANGYKILNLSNEFIRSQDPDLIDVEMDIAKDMLLVCSAGNDGSQGETEVSLRGDHWLSVGAVDGDDHPKYYSSWGDGAVDIMALSGNPWEGTSFSAPRATGYLCVYFIKYFDRFGHWPSPELARKFAIAQTEDIWEIGVKTSGYDLRSGFGVFEPPMAWDDDTLKVLTPKNPRVLMEMIDDNGRVRKANIDVYDKQRIKLHEDKGFYKVGDYINPSAM